MAQVVTRKRDVSSLMLNFIVLGGGIAWLLHLLLTYAVAEFGCVGHVPDFVWLGIEGIAWLLIAASVLPIVLCLASIGAAYRTLQNLQQAIHGGGEINRPEMQLVRIGLILNSFFLLTILAQTVPIFYYLDGC